MRLKKACLEELRRLGVIVLCALVAGMVLEQLPWALALVAPAYLAVMGYELVHTVAWMSKDPRSVPPDGKGLAALLASITLDEHASATGKHDTLAAQLQRMETVLHAMPDAIVEVDAEHRIVWSNASAEPLLGVRLETDTGQPIDNLVRHPQFIEYLRDGQSSDTLTIPSPADPDRLVTVRVMPYGETQSVVLARDDTERTRLERMREDFISNVSHELKTPLTVLGGYVETMEDAGQDLPERWQRPTKAMSEQVVRMSRLVEDLLLLARLESMERPSEEHPVNVPALLEGLMEEARILSGAANHELTLEATPGLWLHANPAELRAAFSNLVANAVHYTPASGRISVRWHTDGRTAFFEVEDSGEGIDKQHLGRLTERFYRADPGRARAHGGTGLGLAIVKHALQHYDAVLEIQSTIGAGSEFRCRFPAERILRATEHHVSA